MNFIDLCAGIGGIRLGLEQAGHTCVGFCEFDKFALQSYKAIHNTEGEWEAHDITKVTDDEIRELSPLEQLKLFAEDFHAKLLVSQGKNKVLMTCEAISFLRFADLLKLSARGILSVKTSKDFCLMKTGELLGSSSPRWQNWGIASNGRYLTAKITASRKTGSVCSLSDILETEVAEKYFLSDEQTAKILANCRK